MEPLRKPRAQPRARVSDRNADLAVIHIRAAACGLIKPAREGFAANDDDYRQLVRTVSNNTTDSAARLDHTQRARLIEMIAAVERSLGIVAAPKKRRFTPLTRPQAKVFAIWKTLETAGVVRSHEDKSLRAFIRRQEKVDALEFCDAAVCSRLIEALKAWAKRTGVALLG